MSLALGFSGGPNLLGEEQAIAGLSRLFFHDSAAVLLDNGSLLHAVEEERISRIKHTNDFPAGAVRACIRQTATEPSLIEFFAYPFEEAFCNGEFRRAAAGLRVAAPSDARVLLASNLERALQSSCDPRQIRFVRHHDAHCAAAFAASPFPSALVFVLDGMGERESASIYAAGEGGCELLATQPVEASLGFFYSVVTRLLGFGDFDEYKVMGLAPYGDPLRYAAEFYKLYHPRTDGSFLLDVTGVAQICWRLGVPDRVPGGPILQPHKDFAAAAQALLERICLGLMSAWQRRTGLRSACVVGGVAQNCAMNGVLARSDLFESIYVHPASHDAGAALGAALVVENDCDKGRRSAQLFFPLTGRRISEFRAEEQVEALKPWRDVLVWELPADIHSATATVLADGKVVGWARGRAEFGPRALGARSILADPRPAENWKRINLLIKKREDFRPFAPSVLEESAGRHFELPRTTCNLSEMCFTVQVREHWQPVLGAVTHVDGTARVQLVSRDVNPDFWAVISAFESLTGIGVLLNTSFNNNFEPIVDSPEDAVRTFLVTGLDYLVLGPYFVRKTALPANAMTSWRVIRRPGMTLTRTISNWQERIVAARGQTSLQVSPRIADVLSSSMDDLSSIEFADECASPDICGEIFSLWEAGVIDLRPRF